MKTCDTVTGETAGSADPAGTDVPDKLPGTTRRDGVTLVEMMIASGILILGLTAFMTAFTVARRSAAMAQYEMEAVHTVRQAMETLSACAYADSRLSVGTHTLTGLSMSNRYTVAQTPATPSTKDVTVSVYWTVPGKAKVLSLSMSSSFTACLH